MADPFASLLHKCRYSDSQNDLLRFCHFCGESDEGLAFSNPCEESSVSEGIPVASTGIMICSLPESSMDKETLPEEEFQTPEERLLMINFQEQGRELDEEQVGTKIDGVGGNVDAIDPVENVSPDLVRTVDLDKDTDIVFSEEKSPPETDFLMRRTDEVNCSGDPFGGRGAREDRVLECESRILKRKSITEEDLGFSESNGDGSGGGVEQSNQLLTEKILGFLKLKGGSPCKSASKSPEISQKISTPAYKTNKNVEFAKDCTRINEEINVENSKPGDNGGAPERGEETAKLDSPLNSVEDVVEVNSSNGKILGLDHPQTDEHNSEMGNPTSKRTEKMEDPGGFRRLPKWVDGVAENAIRGSVSGGMREVGQVNGLGVGGRRVGELEDSSQDRRRMREREGLGPSGRKDIESFPSENLPKSLTSLMDIINSIQDGRRMGGLDSSNPDGRRRAVEAPSSMNPPQPIINLLDTISKLSKEVDPSEGDVDILEVAERAGVKFPRPRWWRPGGY